jgi:hypothetical protein
VQSQRNDRQDNYDRTKAPQDSPVSHMMYVNAQELMFMARRRLCMQADPFTRKVMEEICRQVVEVCPEFNGLLVPNCEYMHCCNEFYPCGRWNNKKPSRD